MATFLAMQTLQEFIIQFFWGFDFFSSFVPLIVDLISFDSTVPPGPASKYIYIFSENERPKL